MSRPAWAGIVRLNAKVAAFSAIAFLPSMAMLAGLAAVARTSTVEGWSALGIGSSVGGIVGLMVLYGWSLDGPVRVARANKEDRRRLYGQSVADRGVIFAVLMVPGALGAALLSDPGARGLAVAMTTAVALNAFSALWFAVGASTPSLCLHLETVPKVVGTAVGGVLAVAGAPVIVFPIFVALGNVSGTIWVTSRVLEGRLDPVLQAMRTMPVSLRTRGRAAATEVTGGIYSVACVALVSAVASPAITATYVSADRLFRASLIPVAALTGSLQQGVSRSSGNDFRRRAGIALLAHFGLGLIGLAVLTIFGRSASKLLFGSALAIPQGAAVAFGVAFLAVSVNSTLARHVLANQERMWALLLGTSAGVVFGGAGIVLGATYHGTVGAAVGVAIGEAAVLLAFAAAALFPRRAQASAV